MSNFKSYAWIWSMTLLFLVSLSCSGDDQNVFSIISPSDDETLNFSEIIIEWEGNNETEIVITDVDEVIIIDTVQNELLNNFKLVLLPDSRYQLKAIQGLDTIDVGFNTFNSLDRYLGQYDKSIRRTCWFWGTSETDTISEVLSLSAMDTENYLLTISNTQVEHKMRFWSKNDERFLFVSDFCASNCSTLEWYPENDSLYISSNTGGSAGGKRYYTSIKL